jgi:hypothetical protein
MWMKRKQRLGFTLPCGSGLPDSELVTANRKEISTIRRIDFIGVALLSTAIVSFLFSVDFLAEQEWGQTPKLIMTTSSFFILILTFIIVEAKYIRVPIPPPPPPKLVLRRDVATTYLINIFQSAAQMKVNTLTVL